MSMQAVRSEDRVFPVCFTLSIRDHERAKDVARKNRMSFAEYVRAALIEAMDNDKTAS